MSRPLQIGDAHGVVLEIHLNAEGCAWLAGELDREHVRDDWAAKEIIDACLRVTAEAADEPD